MGTKSSDGDIDTADVAGDAAVGEDAACGSIAMGAEICGRGRVGALIGITASLLSDRRERGAGKATEARLSATGSFGITDARLSATTAFRTTEARLSMLSLVRRRGGRSPAIPEVITRGRLGWTITGSLADAVVAAASSLSSSSFCT